MTVIEHEERKEGKKNRTSVCTHQHDLVDGTIRREVDVDTVRHRCARIRTEVPEMCARVERTTDEVLRHARRGRERDEREEGHERGEHL